MGDSPHIPGEREASLQGSRVVGLGSRTPHPGQVISHGPDSGEGVSMETREPALGLHPLR